MWSKKQVPVPQPQQPAMDLDDMIFTMKMQAKTFQRQSNKAENEAKKQTEKARAVKNIFT